MFTRSTHLGKYINTFELNFEHKQNFWVQKQTLAYFLANEECTCHMCGCKPLEYAQR